MHLCDDKILKNILQLQIFNQVLTAVKIGFLYTYYICIQKIFESDNSHGSIIQFQLIHANNSVMSVLEFNQFKYAIRGVVTLALQFRCAGLYNNSQFHMCMRTYVRRIRFIQQKNTDMHGLVRCSVLGRLIIKHKTFVNLNFCDISDCKSIFCLHKVHRARALQQNANQQNARSL